MKHLYDLFLSHNGVDKAWTERLAVAVETDKNGPPLRVYFDKWDLPAGGDIPLELEKALESSRYVGLVLTPEALASSWVSLERSSVIASDPSAANLTLIPLLRIDCRIPRMLARIKYIDFRRDHDFKRALYELIRIVRGKPHDRGRSLSQEDIQFREDAGLLKQHRKIFFRNAFGTTCIEELFLTSFIEAIDATQAALNTGSLYSRDGHLLSNFADRSAYKTPEFREGFNQISKLLTELRREATILESFLMQENLHYNKATRSIHNNIRTVLEDLSGQSPEKVKAMVRYMDRIDSLRNRIILILNSLLMKCDEGTFEILDLSSDLIKQGYYGRQLLRHIEQENL
jgi:hypothetical protein